MSPPPFHPLTGHCNCKTITYTLLAPPMITNCCHCTYCQRQSGSAFAINSLIETYNFRVTSTTHPTLTGLPSPSSPTGEKHIVATCPRCLTTLYAHYGVKREVVFVKAASLDEESRGRVRPDVHIFTESKIRWVDLRGEVERGVKVFKGFYKMEEVWSPESLRRRERLVEWVEEEKKKKKKEGGEQGGVRSEG